jgi:hypothetical protein
MKSIKSNLSKDLKPLSRVVSLGAIKQIICKPWLALKLVRFFRQYIQYRKMEQDLCDQAKTLRIYPCLADNQPAQDVGSYFYQDCWAARQVFREHPRYMVDVGSTVLLVGILSQYTDCISVDVRPITANLDGLTATPGTALCLPFNDNEVPCLTTMCVLEHIGLGRYGDPINPNGTIEAVAEISRVIAPGGVVIYSVPVGRELLEFNANRRFSYQQARELFKSWEIVDTCILTPEPRAFESEEVLLSYKEPVACFCVRKPR